MNADQMADGLIENSGEELAAFSTGSIDITRSLDDEVIVARLSGGDTIATWIAQKHEDVDTAVMVAPFLGIGFLTTSITPTREDGNVALTYPIIIDYITGAEE